jgi:predicted permease
VFETTAIAPLAGRVFGEPDDRPSAAKLAIVSERLWRTRFGGDPSLVGRSIVLDAEAHTVVGIMPAGMRFPSRSTDVWLPLGRFVSAFPVSRGSHPALTAVGRLKRGVSVDAARAAMSTIARRLSDAYPDSNRGSGIVVSPYHALIVENVRPAFVALAGAVGLVLLVACANLANLMLARAGSRAREFAVRSALGAARWRLAGQLLTEGLVLAAAGGALGLLLSVWVVNGFVATEPSSVPRADLIRVDWRAAAFAAGVSTLTAILFSLIPAWRASRTDPQHGLRAGRSAFGGPSRLRGALVAIEIAVAVVVLVGAGLVTKSLSRLLGARLGFDPSHAVTMRVALPAAAYPTTAAWTTLHDELLARLRSTAAFDAAGFSSSLPFGGGAAESSMIKEGDPLPVRGERPALTASIHVVSAGYFDAMGVPIARGRDFAPADRRNSTPVAVVDDVLAARLFPGESPIGRRIAFEYLGEPPDIEPIWRDIVGVVGHVRHYSLASEPPHLQVFVPYPQLPGWYERRRPEMAIVVRSRGPADAAVAAVRQMLRDLDRGLPVYGVQTLAGHVAQASEQPRLGSLVLGAFGGFALLLAGVGVYGVLSWTVVERTREIGLRMALGARRGHVAGLVARRVLGVAIVGLTIGSAAALAATRLLEGLLFDVSPTDPATYAAAAGAVAIAALAASLAPARRASIVDPVVSMRME